MRHLVIGTDTRDGDDKVLFTFVGTEVQALERAKKDNTLFGGHYIGIRALRLYENRFNFKPAENGVSNLFAGLKGDGYLHEEEGLMVIVGETFDGEIRLEITLDDEDEGCVYLAHDEGFSTAEAAIRWMEENHAKSCNEKDFKGFSRLL